MGGGLFMAADGRIVIDVILDDGSVVQGLADINGQFGDLDRNGNSKLAKIGAGMKNLAKMAAVGVAGVAGVVAAVGAMTGPLAQAAASANALSSQFEQVFGELESSATKGLNNIAEQTNILPERLKGSFTQMAAFAKTTGLDTAGALALTERATLAAADSAAFYDKSIEEVTESLQSFLKGNFENDAALGISATETTRNAKANELYGKSFIKLDEAQKQLTLLAMVEDGNKLSGALGQAAREGESLENVTGNLKQAWENLKAQLGQYVLQSTIDGIVLLTKVIQNFDITPFVNAFSTLKNLVVPIVSSFVEEAKAIFGTLREHWSTNGQSIIDNLRSTFEMIQEAVVPRVTEAFELIKNVISDVRAIWEQDGQAIVERISSIFQSLKEIAVPIVEDAIGLIVSNFQKIKEFWETDGQQIVQAVSNIFQGVLATIEFLMPAAKFVIDYVWTAIKNIITGALDVIMGAVKIFSGLFTGDFSKMWEGTKQLFKGAIDLILGWMSLTFLGGIRTALINLGKAALSIVKGMWDDIAKLFTGAGSLISNTVSKMATSVVNFFKNIWTQGSNIFGTLKTFGATTFEALRQAVTTTVSRLAINVVQYVTNLGTNFLNIITSLKSGVTKKFQEIKDEIIDKVKSIDLMQIGKDIVSGLINGIGAMFVSVQTKIEQLASSIPEWAKKILGIHSPSRVMKEIGLWTGEGLVIGLDSSSKNVNKAMQNIGNGILNVSKSFQKEYNNLLSEFSKKNENKEDQALKKIQNIRNSAAKKKKSLTKAQIKEIERLEKSYTDQKSTNKISFDKQYKALVEKSEKEYFNVIKNYVEDKKSLNELSLADEAEIWKQSIEMFVVGSQQRIQAQKNYNKTIQLVDKQRLDDIESSVANKKSLDKLSLIDEVKIWEESNKLFKEGSDERIKAQQNYQKAVEAVNKEIVNINKEYQSEMLRIDEEYVKEAERINKEYEDTFNNRVSSLLSFASTFEEFKVELIRTGEELTTNLQSQVDGFKLWQEEFEKLSSRGVDSELLDELSNLGVKALPELVALNSMTDEQLTRYSELYREKSQLAREQAGKELEGMRKDTDKKLLDLRAVSDAQLSKLQTEWDLKIKNLVRATDVELSTLHQVGVDAGQGLLDGLASMESPLVDKAREIADAIKATIQSALDIHSPSRWMRDFVAGNLAKGFSVGVDKNSSIFTDASARIGDLMKANIVNPLRGISLDLGSIGSKSLSQIQNSSYTNQINNSRTMHNQITVGSKEDAAAYERLMRRMKFEFGL